MSDKRFIQKGFDKTLAKMAEDSSVYGLGYALVRAQQVEHVPFESTLKEPTPQAEVRVCGLYPDQIADLAAFYHMQTGKHAEDGVDLSVPTQTFLLLRERDSLQSQLTQAKLEVERLREQFKCWVDRINRQSALLVELQSQFAEPKLEVERLKLLDMRNDVFRAGFVEGLKANGEFKELVLPPIATHGPDLSADSEDIHFEVKP